MDGVLPGVLPLNKAEALVWDENNTKLSYLLTLTTTGAANARLYEFERKRDGLAAWQWLLGRYQGTTGLQRYRRLKREFRAIVMDEDEDPDIYLSRIFHFRDELAAIGRHIHKDRLMDRIVEGLPEYCYSQLKVKVESDEDWSLEDTTAALQCMYRGRVLRKGRATRAKTHESAMKANGTAEKPRSRVACAYCRKSGHRKRDCFK